MPCEFSRRPSGIREGARRANAGLSRISGQWRAVEPRQYLRESARRADVRGFLRRSDRAACKWTRAYPRERRAARISEVSSRRRDDLQGQRTERHHEQRWRPSRALGDGLSDARVRTLLETYSADGAARSPNPMGRRIRTNRPYQ